MAHEYIMTDLIYNRLLAQLGSMLFCDVCLAPLQPGDRVVAKESGKNGCKRRKHYHAVCHDSLYMP